jgi:predicted phage tail protein
MTTINLHGLLAKEYEKKFVLKLAKARDVVRAIDCNKKGFLRRINELKKDGLHYEIIVNRGKIGGEIDRIDLVPMIVGSAGVGASGMSGGMNWGGLVTNLAIGVGTAMLSKALKPKPEQRPDVGGTVTSDRNPLNDDPVTFNSRAAVASMLFNNVANIASQGEPVPIGYGRLKIGSSVVQATVKSFPMSHRTALAFQQNPFGDFAAEDLPNVQQIYSAAERDE